MYRTHRGHRYGKFILYCKPNGKRTTNRPRQNNGNRPKRQPARSVSFCSIGENKHKHTHKGNDHTKAVSFFVCYRMKRQQNKGRTQGRRQGKQTSKERDKNGPLPHAGGHRTQAKGITSPRKAPQATNATQPKGIHAQRKKGPQKGRKRPRKAIFAHSLKIPKHGQKCLYNKPTTATAENPCKPLENCTLTSPSPRDTATADNGRTGGGRETPTPPMRGGQRALHPP